MVEESGREEPHSAETRAADPVEAKLRELADTLRETPELGPDAQAALADLVDELARTVHGSNLPPEAKAHLVQSTESLARGLHQGRSTSFLAAAKERLRDAALRAETEAPLTAGIVERLLDTLANLGI